MSNRISLINNGTFDVTKFRAKKGVQKTTTNAAGVTIKYTLVEFEYNYAADDQQPYYAPFMMELYPLDAEWGAQEATTMADKTVIEGKWNISASLDENNQYHVDMITIFDQMWDKAMNDVYANKTFNALCNRSFEILKSKFKSIYTIPLTEEGERDRSKNLQFRTTSEKRIKPMLADKSVFDFKDIKTQAFSFVGVYKFQLYQSGEIWSFQRKLQSIMVSNFRPRGNLVDQNETCDLFIKEKYDIFLEDKALMDSIKAAKDAEEKTMAEDKAMSETVTETQQTNKILPKRDNVEFKTADQLE